MPYKFKRERYPPATWLRELTSPHVSGRKVGSDVFPTANKESVIDHYNHYGYVRRLRNLEYRLHSQGHQTFYFQGSTWGKRTLVMIDIDVQKVRRLGGTEGAIQFVKYLKKHYFPTLYWEMSTNGRGVHAYIVVEKSDGWARQVNRSLELFERWLERRAKGFDIEKVEVMGHCPEIVMENRKMACMKFGSMAKIPRGLDARFEELKQTTVLGWLDLRELPETDFAKPKSPVALKPLPVLRDNANTHFGGSCTGKNISEEELADLPHFEHLAEQYLGGMEVKAGKHIATAGDFAIAFLLLRFFKKNRNADGTLPTARVAGLWQALFDAGDVDRPWNHHRWKAIRDAMSSWGLLVWHEERYQPGYWLGDKYQKGVACQFEISDEFLARIEEGGASFMDTAVVASDKYPRPKRVWELLTPPYRKIDRFLTWAYHQIDYQMAA